MENQNVLNAFFTDVKEIKKAMQINHNVINSFEN